MTSKSKTGKINNRQKIFYILIIISILTILIGLLLPQSATEKLNLTVNWENKYFQPTDLLLYLPFASLTWIGLFGMFFVPKNFFVWLLSIILLIPGLFILLITYNLSFDIIYTLKFYVFLLSFGLLRL